MKYIYVFQDKTLARESALSAGAAQTPDSFGKKKKKNQCIFSRKAGKRLIFLIYSLNRNEKMNLEAFQIRVNSNTAAKNK